MYLFFDTETNGFPPKARMAQLAFSLTDFEGNIIKEYSSIIKPDGWEIPKEKFFIENNMSTERCILEGIPVYDALREFQDALKIAQFKIAHNIRFDNQIVSKEIKLAGITHELFQFKKSYCTMLSSVDYCKLPGRYNSYKWPKLEELHRILFGSNFDDAHDAGGDVRAMIKCFFELKRLKIIK